MEDDLDLSSLYGADATTQAAPAPPPMPLPFTQADSLRLQRLQQGLSATQGMVDSGELHPEEGAGHQQLIMGQLQPLLARQKAWQQQQQQEAVQQLQQAQAVQAAMEHSEAAFRARGVGDRIGTYTDPLSGQTVHLIEDGPNKWRELPLGAGADSSGDVSGETTAAGDTTVAQAPEEATTADSGAQNAQAQPAVAPAPDGGHVMQIQNGVNVERWHFAPDGTTTLVGRQGPAQQPAQGQAGAGALNDAEVAELRRRAGQIVGPPPPRTGNPRVDQALALSYQKALGGMTSHMLVMHARAKQATANQGALADRAQGRQDFEKSQLLQREQFRKEQGELHDRQAKERQGKSDQWLKFYSAAATQLSKKDENGVTHAPTHEQVMERVQQMLDAHDKYVNPEAGYKLYGDAAQMGPPAPTDHAKLTGMSPDEAKRAAGALAAPPPLPPPARNLVAERFGGHPPLFPTGPGASEPIGGHQDTSTPPPLRWIRGLMGR